MKIWYSALFSFFTILNKDPFSLMKFCINLFSALQKKPSERNLESCDMWSFAILLWELSTREVPFSEYSPMEIGFKVLPYSCIKFSQLPYQSSFFFISLYSFVSGGH